MCERSRGLFDLLAFSEARAGQLGCVGPTAAFDNGASLAFNKGTGLPLDILAIGSSSTEGVGASSPANAYPARLKDELEKETGVDFDVKNAGIGGELATKTVERL